MRSMKVIFGILLGAALFSACSSDKGSASRTGDPVLGGGPGSPCTADAQCVGYSHPSCLTELKPVAEYVDGGRPGAALFRGFTIPFPGGYCSNTLENSCTSDADCGTSAGCFRPFEGVSSQVIDNLNKLVPFDVHAFAGVGLCLEPCTSDSQCRTGEGYTCITPIHTLMQAFNGSYTRKFCMKDVDTSYLLQAPPDGG